MADKEKHVRRGTWSLVGYRTPDSSRVRTGALTPAGQVHSLSELPPMRLLGDWDTTGDRLRDWQPDLTTAVADAELVAPLTYPSKVLCSGANYHSHLAEMGVPARDTPAEAYFFPKTPSTTVIGPGAAIPYPAGPDRRLDWEAELAVVIGRAGRGFSPQNAPAHIAGYTIANDVSARDALVRPDPVGPPFQYDWLRAKSLDGFCPLGPGIVPHWFVADPQDLRIRLWVNGESKQDARTSDMIRPVCELLSVAARDMTLLPGDVVLTGSPAGVGMARGEALAVGDEIVIEIEGLGRLTNTVGPVA